MRRRLRSAGTTRRSARQMAGVLRQGDICALDAYPSYDLRKVSRQTGHLGDHVVLPQLDRVYPSENGDGLLAAVCSQCCDLENPGKRSGVLIAPLRYAPAKATDSARLDEIRGSAVRDASGAY